MDEAQNNIPSNDSDGCLKPPVVNIVNSTDLPKRIGTKNVIPETLPNNARCPEVTSALLPTFSGTSIPFPAMTALCARDRLSNNAIPVKPSGDYIKYKGGQKLLGGQFVFNAK